MALRGLASVLGIAGPRPEWTPERSLPSARYAAETSCAATKREPDRRAATSADGSFVVAVLSLPRAEYTYCINVPSVREFVLASGHVVHNSDAADHGYDALAGLLMARVPHAQRPKPNGKHVDDHPGFAKRYELEPVEIGEGEVQWSRLPPGYEEDTGW